MQAVYYRTRDGSEPVDDFIDRLPDEHQDAIDAAIRLLNHLDATDPPLTFPHSSHVEGPLRELRCHYGRHLYRILYQRSENLFVLLHILEKRERKLPAADIQLAQQRWDEFKTRMDATPRTPPRPAGHDAP